MEMKTCTECIHSMCQVSGVPGYEVYMALYCCAPELLVPQLRGRLHSQSETEGRIFTRLNTKKEEGIDIRQDVEHEGRQ